MDAGNTVLQEAEVLKKWTLDTKTLTRGMRCSQVE